MPPRLLNALTSLSGDLSCRDEGVVTRWRRHAAWLRTVRLFRKRLIRNRAYPLRHGYSLDPWM